MRSNYCTILVEIVRQFPLMARMEYGKKFMSSLCDSYSGANGVAKDMIKRKILDYIAELDSPQFLPQIKDHFINTGMAESEVNQAFKELVKDDAIITRTIQGHADLKLDVRLILAKYPDLDYQGILEILNDPGKLDALWAEEEDDDDEE